MTTVHISSHPDVLKLKFMWLGEGNNYETLYNITIFIIKKVSYKAKIELFKY